MSEPKSAVIIWDHKAQIDVDELHKALRDAGFAGSVREVHTGDDQIAIVVAPGDVLHHEAQVIYNQITALPVRFRDFTDDDYLVWNGAEGFDDGKPPRILTGSTETFWDGDEASIEGFIDKTGAYLMVCCEDEDGREPESVQLKTEYVKEDCVEDLLVEIVSKATCWDDIAENPLFREVNL